MNNQVVKNTDPNCNGRLALEHMVMLLLVLLSLLLLLFVRIRLSSGIFKLCTAHCNEVITC